QHYAADYDHGHSSGREDYAPREDYQYAHDPRADDRHHDSHHYADDRQAEPGHHEQAYADVQTHGDGHHYTAGHYVEDDFPLEPHEDEMYDDAPRRRYQSGLATALAL